MTDAPPPLPPSPPPGPLPPPVPPPAGHPDAAPATPPTSDEKTMALLAHILGIVTGFLGPLVIWLIKKNESAYVDHHGKEALNFQLTVLIAAVVFNVILCIPFVGLVAIPALLALGIADLVLCIMAGIKANDGVLYRYPVSIRMIS